MMVLESWKEHLVDGTIGALHLLLSGVDVALSTVLSVFTAGEGTTHQHGDSSADKNKKKPRVVIVGASFAGCKVEQILSQHNNASQQLDITMIDFRDYFEYIPGSLRCFVEPTHFPKLTSSLHERHNLNSKSTKFVQGKLVDIPSNNEITLEGGKSVPFDYLVLGCGSTYAAPVKADGGVTTMSQRQAQYHTYYDQLQKASTVIIVGAGAVGVELAGEILTAFPRNKQVTLVDMAPTILSGFHESSVQYSTKWLKDHGAKLYLGAPTKTIDEKFIVLKDGTRLEADIVYRCNGAAPNTSFLHQSVIKSAYGLNGAVVVNDHLQVEGFTNIYCAGDMNYHAASNEVKLGHTAELNGHLVAENILHQIHNTKSLQGLLRYPMDVVGAEQTPFIYCVSLGKYDASMGFNALVINGPLAAIVKWLLEWTIVATIRQQPIGIYFWRLADTVVNLMARTILPTKRKRS
jgi:apoptosis-inducing factor 2